MTSASWHARISCGRETGAGFLVSERHVLTCAHVVARSGTDEVGVSFAQEPWPTWQNGPSTCARYFPTLIGAT